MFILISAASGLVKIIPPESRLKKHTNHKEDKCKQIAMMYNNVYIVNLQL